MKISPVLFSAAFLTLIIFQSTARAEWTPVEPKHDDPVRYTPSVCMMVHFGDRVEAGQPPLDPLYPGSHNNLVEFNGDIYGGSDNGNCAACYGMLFKMTPAGVFSIIHKFDGVEGHGPGGGLAKGPGNTLYGTTYGGGKVEVQSIAGDYTKYTRNGTIFSTGGQGVTPVWSFRNGWLRKINCKPNIGCDPPWTEKEKKDAPPSYPYAPPVTNNAGVTMGVTPFSNNQRYGALYTLSGGEYSTVEVMDGSKAYKLLSLSPGVTDNNFYGVSAYGKNGNLNGTVFKTSGGPIEVIHEFNGEDGAGPSNVIQGKDKRLYGTTYWGGASSRNKLGLIYRMDADGSNFKILHEFNNTDGAQSVSALVWGKDNRLYGTTRYGGNGTGVLFRMNTDGTKYVVLHKFKMYQTGKGPLGNMIQHSNGNFYGTTELGGRHNAGGIFRLDVGHSIRQGIDVPGQRYCCSLGQNQWAAKWPAPSLNPEELVGHKYGTQEKGDPVGYVYTNRAGLLDIGHVRDMIDMTKFLYEWMMMSDRNYLELRNVTNGIVRPIQLPVDQDEVLKIAGAMAYLDGLGHELITWEQYFTKPEPKDVKLPIIRTPQDFSSFSPEDLVSNVVGIEIAERAIRQYCEMDFDKAVDQEMQKIMKELDAQPASVTDKVRDYVEGFRFGPKAGKWFTENAFWETLWRRNFYVNPWLVPYQNLGAYRPGWLNARRFEPYYKYFDYGVSGAVNGERGVYIGNIFEKIEALRQQWEKDHPGMTRWP